MCPYYVHCERFLAVFQIPIHRKMNLSITDRVVRKWYSRVAKRLATVQIRRSAKKPFCLLKKNSSYGIANHLFPDY